MQSSHSIRYLTAIVDVLDEKKKKLLAWPG